MKSLIDKIADILGKTYDMTLEDARELSWLALNLDYPDQCRVLDGARMIVSDPLYKGDIPPDYFDDEV